MPWNTLCFYNCGSHMEQDFPRAPTGTLIPEKVWLKQKREELSALISGRNLQLRFRHAFELFENDLKGHATPVEMHRVSEEFREGVRRLIKTLSAIPLPSDQESDLPVSFAEVLGLTEETIECIYQCGNRHYEANEVADAADVFHLLACLDFGRHNVWVAQGAAEQMLGHTEAALKSYAMAMLADPNAALAYVHSAECYLALGVVMATSQNVLDAAWQCVSGQDNHDAEQVRHMVNEMRGKLS